MTEHGAPASLPRVHRLGVTGTDTGVGKTVVSCALVTLARARGLRVAAMKPIESGVRDDEATSDAHVLRRAAGDTHDMALVRPCLLAEPLAPMVAAARAGVVIETAQLGAARTALEADADLLVVEGAGGLLVPITERVSFATLFASWRCDLVIIAANRLGVINHVLLTVQAARDAGLAIRGVVLTAHRMAAPDDVAERTNADTLRTLCGGIPVFEFPWLSDVSDPSALTAAAEQAGLATLLDRGR